MIANTAGWDTDCNSGNVGCLMGIKNGLPGIDARLREPVADRLYLSTADGGRCITDAVHQTYEICRIAHQLGQVAPIPLPKQGVRFDWSGTPTTVFRRPARGGKMWLRAWINAVDHVGTRSAFHLSQDRGTGLFIQGSRDWQNYTVQATILSDPAKSFGIAARVQGLTRYYALTLGPKQELRLVRNYDSAEVLAEIPFSWSWSQEYQFDLLVDGTMIVGSVNGSEMICYNDVDTALRDGGIALVCEE
ncbi:MAG TPA: ADP-ribosylglycohydrolase family protein, partial [Chthoniobacterales bacterium]|nr:ADP-ribosylglycohydrolase family protein [Chthoniobacterales bacterium]